MHNVSVRCNYTCTCTLLKGDGIVRVRQQIALVIDNWVPQTILSPPTNKQCLDTCHVKGYIIVAFASEAAPDLCYIHHLLTSILGLEH